MTAERGTFRNTDHARQLGRFDGMRWGNITPTDIDFATDFHGRLFVYADAKYGNAELPVGQRIFFERTCELLHRPPATFAVAFVVSHWEKGDFEFKQTIIRRYLWERVWRVPRQENQTLYAGITHFRRLAGIADDSVREAPKEVPQAPTTTLADHADWLTEYTEAEKQYWPGDAA